MSESFHAGMPKQILCQVFLAIGHGTIPNEVGKEGIARLLVFEMIEHKVFEVVRELTKMSVMNHLPVKQ